MKVRPKTEAEIRSCDSCGTPHDQEDTRLCKSCGAVWKRLDERGQNSPAQTVLDEAIKDFAPKGTGRAVWFDWTVTRAVSVSTQELIVATRRSKDIGWMNRRYRKAINARLKDRRVKFVALHEARLHV